MQITRSKDRIKDVIFRVRLALLAAGLLALVPLAGIAGFLNPSQKPVPAAQTSSAPQDKVDINSATMEQLMKVPGMTRTWAARIIRFRPYRAKNDLLDRGVVTNQVYDRIKDFIIAHREKP